jgi:hypothetical protein
MAPRKSKLKGAEEDPPAQSLVAEHPASDEENEMMEDDPG